jgi:hypothetical protein
LRAGRAAAGAFLRGARLALATLCREIFLLNCAPLSLNDPLENPPHTAPGGAAKSCRKYHGSTPLPYGR